MEYTILWHWDCKSITNYCSSRTHLFCYQLCWWFPGKLCAKYQPNYFKMKCLIWIFEFLHGEILNKTVRMDKLNNTRKLTIDNDADKLYFHYTVLNYFQADIWLDKSHHFLPIQWRKFWNLTSTSFKHYNNKPVNIFPHFDQ